MLLIKQYRSTKHWDTFVSHCILKTHVSPTLSCPLGQASTSQPSGSSDLTMETSPAFQPIMDQGMCLTSSLFTLPLSHQMTHQLDQSPAGSVGCLQALMPSFSRWLSVLSEWMIGELWLTSFTTVNMTKNTRKSTQKFIASSWMPPLLSKIMPYASNALKHPDVLKVSLTSRGWVPSLPMPSGAHASPMKRRTTNDQVQKLIAMGNNSEGEVMKQLLGLVMEDD
jgi:hypothetical protein